MSQDRIDNLKEWCFAAFVVAVGLSIVTAASIGGAALVVREVAREKLWR